MIKQNYKTVGIYVPSYKRSDLILTDKILNDCTYVVRKSEEQLYKDAGVRKVLGVEDDKIDSLAKIRQWIIDNTEEDIVIQVDDDLTNFIYKGKNNKSLITDKDVVDMELERISQLLSDLELGFASFTMTGDVRKFNKEFLFKGIIGSVVFFNKECLKSKYDDNSKFKVDTDFVLQELLHNRIILVPDYVGMSGKYDKNSGGNNVGKNLRKLKENVQYLKMKWGKYFDHDFRSNQSKINVKR